NAIVVRLKTLKGGHIKMTLGGEVKNNMEALWFSPSSKIAKEQLYEGATVDLIVELQWNYFRGNKSLQLLVKDLKLT
ncbi:MAG: single-stranded-DNA-specific exonuclease RecJ, partial [Bdellovibrionales bacterium]|nr:single-stranded-DNA-specific exonuclease RecJ [Bdellovibrionales bacterium]